MARLDLPSEFAQTLLLAMALEEPLPAIDDEMVFHVRDLVETASLFKVRPDLAGMLTTP